MATNYLGLNVLSVNFFASEQPFLNVFKTGGAWGTNGSGGVGSINLDANGYPTAIPVIGGATNVDVLMRQGTFNESGTYVAFYDGTGSVAYGDDAVQVGSTGTYGGLAGSSSVVSSTTKRAILTVDSSQGNGIHIVINSTDPGSTGDNIRNMGVVYSPGSDATHVGAREQSLLNGEIFDPNFLIMVRPFSRIRFTNWMAINVIPIDTLSSDPFSARALSSWAFWCFDSSKVYSTGAKSNLAPIEVMCQLCNEIGADAWFNMPALCSDAYMSSFATLVHSLLKTTAYVEFALEVWNFGYTYVYDLYKANKAAHPAPAWQAGHTYVNGDIVVFTNNAYAICATGGVSGGSSPAPVGDPFSGPISDGAGSLTWNSAGPSIGWTVFANRSVHMAAAWHTAYGADASTKLVVCMGGFAFGFTGTDSNGDGGTALNDFYLTCTATTNFGSDTWTGNAASHMDALCVAPYFGGYDNSTLTSVDQVIKEINVGGFGLTPAGSIVQAVSAVTKCASSAATYTAFNGNSLKCVCYESGQGLPGYDGANIHFLLNQAANVDPRMFDSTLNFFNSLKSNGLTSCNYYADIGGTGSFGFWGMLPNLTSGLHSPKYDACLQYINPNRRGMNMKGGF